MIKLDDNYRIETDAHNFILKYERVYFDADKLKDVTQRAEYFYSTLAGALNIYSNECFRAADNITELTVKVKELEALIKSLK